MSDSHEAEEVLMKFKKTRKAYFLEYFCGFFLLILIVLAYGKGITLPKPLQFMGLGLALISLISAEVGRAFVRYQITPTKITVVKGFIKQTKKNFYFHSLAFVPDISLSQSRMQRLLGYGRVYVHGGGSVEMFEIADVDKPYIILTALEDLIRKTRRPAQ
ncbi:PH domain-containing protein [Candidatus Woesearchaeota archaeon]|nr:PH domain-containing protein [Candidatus Woesearchaeota archaeon]